MRNLFSVIVEVYLISRVLASKTTVFNTWGLWERKKEQMLTIPSGITLCRKDCQDNSHNKKEGCIGDFRKIYSFYWLTCLQSGTEKFTCLRVWKTCIINSVLKGSLTLLLPDGMRKDKCPALQMASCST